MSLFFRSRGLADSPCGEWIAANMPELDERLGPMSTAHALDELNRVTGLSIPGYASIADTLPLFLARLKEMKQ